jgi:hypothetical protein
VGAAEANQRVGRERKRDEAAGHLQVGVQQRVSSVGGAVQNPERR